MKKKSFLFENLLCVLLCVTLVFLTFFSSEYISKVILRGINLVFGAKEKVVQLSNANGSVTVIEEDVFSPFGFGGGGYNVTTALNHK